MEPQGKVALVTGAGRRVGRGIALELAAGGFDLAVHYFQSVEPAREVADAVRQIGRRCTLVGADLSDPAAGWKVVEHVQQELGRLDVLVNSAAVFDATPHDKTALKSWDRVFRINVFAPAMLSYAAADAMKVNGQGRIVNLIDIMADRPTPGRDAYCASKAALASLTRSLAIELAPQITVNGISPGVAEFPEEYTQWQRDRILSRVPLARAGSPGEIGQLVRFLVTAGSYITGQIITVDGGRSIVP